MMMTKMLSFTIQMRKVEMMMMTMTLMMKKDGGEGASPADLTLGIRHRSTFALSHTICAFDRGSIFEDDLDHENFDF